jgi:hypothetical protein
MYLIIKISNLRYDDHNETEIIQVLNVIIYPTFTILFKENSKI